MEVQIPTQLKELVDNLNYWELKKINEDKAIALQSCYAVIHFVMENGGMVSEDNENLDKALKVLISNGIIDDTSE